MKSINFETSVELLGNVIIPVPGAALYLSCCRSTGSGTHLSSSSPSSSSSCPSSSSSSSFSSSPSSPSFSSYFTFSSSTYSISSFYFSAVSKGRQTAPPILSANVRKGIFICTVFVLSWQECNGCLWFKMDTIHHDCFSHGPGLS